jgi:uncharacterized NAD(P)/FAD-binding protein YdhS
MTAVASDRRQHGRGPSAAHQILTARVRPGHNAVIVDLSRSGVLLEVSVRLLPGAPVDVQFDSKHERTALGGRVVRSTVIRLSSSGIWYHAAVAFDRLLPTTTPEIGYEVPPIVVPGCG